MRIVRTIFFSGLIALAVPATVALARTSEAPKAAEMAESPPCYSYEQNADGSWKQTACQENGLKAPIREKVSTQASGKATR